MKQYEVEFYEDEQGFCPIADWIRELDRVRSKENRSMIKKVYYQIERLENRKKSQKTQRHEIEQAKREYISWLKRGEKT